MDQGMTQSVQFSAIHHKEKSFSNIGKSLLSPLATVFLFVSIENYYEGNINTPE